MKINSPDYKLNLKLVLKDKESSGNVPMKADKLNEKPKLRFRKVFVEKYFENLGIHNTYLCLLSDF